MIEVTEADREASVSLFVWLFQDGHSLEPFTAKDHMGGERDDHIILRTLATHRIEAAKAERDKLDAAYLEAFAVHMGLVVTNWPEIKHVPTAIALAAKTMDAMVSFQTLRALPDDVASYIAEKHFISYETSKLIGKALADALESKR